MKGARALLEENPLAVLDLWLDGVSSFLAGDPKAPAPPGRRAVPGWRRWPTYRGGPDPDRAARDADPDRGRGDRSSGAAWPVEALVAAIELAPEVVAWRSCAAPGRECRSPAGRCSPRSPSARPGSSWSPGRHVRAAGRAQRSGLGAWTLRGGAPRHQRSGCTNAGAAASPRAAPASISRTSRPRSRPPAASRHGEPRPRPRRKRPLPRLLAARAADVPGVADAVGLPRVFATGRIDLAGSFEGSLAHKVPAWLGLTGLLSLRARDGEIRRVLPAVVAIALASRSFNPFTGREQIRYDRAETVIEFADGRMHTEALSIDGPDLRIFASGDLSIASPAHEVDAHVVLFLFRQIDNVIGRIPVLNLLLGPNENLLAAYFDLTGPWAEPEATLVPLRSLASGPASLVVEGVPFWVRRGLQAIGAIDADAVGAPARAFSPEPPPRHQPPQRSHSRFRLHAIDAARLRYARPGRRPRLAVCAGPALRSAPPRCAASSAACRASLAASCSRGRRRGLCAAQRRGGALVFPNGCFDMLHIGHIRCLEAARRLGLASSSA